VHTSALADGIDVAMFNLRLTNSTSFTFIAVVSSLVISPWCACPLRRWSITFWTKYFTAAGVPLNGELTLESRRK
jgi:hypothetical protein